jgi:UDP-N-acetylglucosamine--N-acetylmuramyl-(pentapeptide) pyrophosphoryl-undecaprenol N-acetylglucosamine transferase
LKRSDEYQEKMRQKRPFKTAAEMYELLLKVMAAKK